MYKFVSPCLDVSSGSFAFGRSPADVSIAELHNQFSGVILLFFSFYYSTPCVVYLILPYVWAKANHFAHPIPFLGIVKMV